jgi:hypothetical protein
VVEHGGAAGETEDSAEDSKAGPVHHPVPLDDGLRGMSITMTSPAARGTRAVTGFDTLVVHVCNARTAIAG